jgi:hypothetical protein
VRRRSADLLPGTRVRLDQIDGRSDIGRALRRAYADLVTQLGGPDEVTPAMAILIEQAAVKLIITQSVGEWLLSQSTLVDVDRKALIPVVLQHDQLQGTLARLLSQVGLERKAKQVEDIRSRAGLVD